MTATRHTATYTTEHASNATGIEYQTAEAENGTWARVTRNGEIVAGPDRNASAMMRAYQQEMRNAGWTHPEDNGSQFCLVCGDVFATTALLDVHQDETGHEKDQSTEVTITVARPPLAVAEIRERAWTASETLCRILDPKHPEWRPALEELTQMLALAKKYDPTFPADDAPDDES